MPMPAWAQQLSEKYLSRTFAMFVLHGNVRDQIPAESTTAGFLPLHRYLREVLFARRDLIITYDRGGGISFATSEMQADFGRAVSGYDSFHGTNYASGLPRSPDAVLGLLDNYLRLR